MSRQQRRTRGTSQDRTRAQAREQTQRRRHELELLADPDTFDLPPSPGALLSRPDEDAFDDTDGDAHLTESDTDDTPEVADEEVTPPPAITLRRLLGTQPPLALVRLHVNDDHVRAALLIAPRPALRDALDELCALTEDVFRRGREQLTEPEWRSLLGLDPIPMTLRLLLLSRIAIVGSEKVRLNSEVTFQPNNHGLERYAGKLALLPDGVPFSLRLLLKGATPVQRSRDPDMAAHPFGALPEAVKLLALRRALALEAADGTARTDEDFRALLGRALTELGLDQPRPFWKHVEMLRSNLTRRGLPDVFPNSRQRQRQYDEART
jgi:hypothetical protein